MHRLANRSLLTPALKRIISLNSTNTTNVFSNEVGTRICSYSFMLIDCAVLLSIDAE